MPRTLNVTLEELPTSALMTPEGSLASLPSLAPHLWPSRGLYDTWRGPGSFLDTITGSFKPGSGFHTNIYSHRNIFLGRMFDILEGTLADMDAGTIIQSCRINNEAITVRNILGQMCPIAIGAGSRIGSFLDQLDRGKEPGFLARALLPIALMGPSELDRLKVLQVPSHPKYKELREGLKKNVFFIHILWISVLPRG